MYKMELAQMLVQEIMRILLIVIIWYVITNVYIKYNLIEKHVLIIVDQTILLMIQDNIALVVVYLHSYIFKDNIVYNIVLENMLSHNLELIVIIHANSI